MRAFQWPCLTPKGLDKIGGERKGLLSVLSVLPCCSLRSRPRASWSHVVGPTSLLKWFVEMVRYSSFFCRLQISSRQIPALGTMTQTLGSASSCVCSPCRPLFEVLQGSLLFTTFDIDLFADTCSACRERNRCSHLHLHPYFGPFFFLLSAFKL
jgi:hypothetical protein